MRQKYETELEGESKEERWIMKGRGNGLKKTEGVMGTESTEEQMDGRAMR